MLRTGKAAEYLGVHPQTIRRYANSGELPFVLSKSGQRIFKEEDLDKFIIKPDTEEIIAFYVRSSDGSKDRIDSQINLLTRSYGEPEYTIVDRASGLNDNRKGLNSLIKLAQEKKITKICITQEDRLTRFGFRYLEMLFSELNVNISVLGKKENQTLEEELLQDFMSLIASFSGKFYRMRSTENKLKLLNLATEELNKNE